MDSAIRTQTQGLRTRSAIPFTQAASFTQQGAAGIRSLREAPSKGEVSA